MLPLLIYQIFSISFYFSSVWCNFTISVIHFNDFHARYEPITNSSTTCHSGMCIGGFSRLYSAINTLKTVNPNAILLNAGDNFQGTIWYHLYKWNVTQHFLNKLPLDALTLGNHEFDDGIVGLVPFLKSIKAPVICANIDASKEPEMQNLYTKSVIIERNGKKIGVIGVILATTNLFSKTGNLQFLDEVESVNSEAEKLANEGVFTNIILSHCGYDLDLKIAKKATAKISLIVGGHTDTFLYTGTPIPGCDKPKGPYPTIILNSNNDKVLVVQASAYTKYLGNIEISFDNFGKISTWQGAPIFLGQNAPTDPEIDVELSLWKKMVDINGNKFVGRSLFAMPHTPCRSEECLLGNFATDAMVFAGVQEMDNNSWTLASVAMMHAGGMRAGIDKGDITYNQLITTFPFEDSINICEFKGEHLLTILESSVDDGHLANPHLFQVSGIHITFNFNKFEGQRIEDLQIRCRECPTPIYHSLNLKKYYRVALPGFLINSGFNPLLQKYKRNMMKLGDDINIYKAFLSARSPLYQEIEGRITIIT